ncbi:protein-L-isoaspartate O-methyltransferase family protein [Streptomyces sp. NPDC054961]
MDAAVPALQSGREPARSAVRPAGFPAAGEEVNRAICRAALVTAGLLREPWLGRAFDAVDREAFVPSAVWLDVPDAEGRWTFVDRAVEPDVWRRAVWDPHRAVITQLNDGDGHGDGDSDGYGDKGPATGQFSSSVSAPDVVLRKLGHLDLEPSARVLEIGYGSGYHTALLCERVGARRVVTVEVDAEVARSGASSLAAAGYAPELIVGDGLRGAPGGDPFDRVISTAALRRVPYAWIEQSRRNGVILTPFGTAYSNAGLLRLRVDGAAAKAEGRFVGEASYMWIRTEGPAVRLEVAGGPAGRRSPVDPAQVLGLGHLQDFAIGLQVPDVSFSHRGDGGSRQVQFVDEAGTSATLVRYADWWEEGAVRSWGPRDLWAEVTAAYTWYEVQGRPHLTRFGVTVDRDGQYAWLDEPRHRLGPPPGTPQA